MSAQYRREVGISSKGRKITPANNNIRERTERIQIEREGIPQREKREITYINGEN
jgi:hypothetical protein